MKTLRPYLLLLPLICCVILVSVNSCRSATNEIGKEQATDIAKNESIKRGWSEVEVGDARLTDGQWRILVWRLPKAPGGWALIVISLDGKSIRFVPGK